jgi:hypothetical protein
MNSVENISETTNTNEITFSGAQDTGVYESEYEAQILKRDEGNDLYKVFDIKVNGHGGWGYSGLRYLPNAWIVK